MTTIDIGLDMEERLCLSASLAGLECQVWSLRRTATEVVCRNGRMERQGTSSYRLVSAGVAVDGREGFATACGTVDPDTLVAAATATALVLPPSTHQLALPSPSPSIRTPTIPAPDLSWSKPVMDRLRTVGNVVGKPSAEDIELRGMAERRSVRMCNTAGLQAGYISGWAHLNARITCRGDSVGHLSHDFYARTPGQVVDAAAEELPRLSELARVMSGRPAPLAGEYDVLLDGRVATRLLSLAGPALGRDAVAQGRSRFAEAAANVPVAVPLLSLVDDSRDERCPYPAPIDDEGTATRRTVLIADGLLRSYLTDRRHASRHRLTRTASGWRGPDGEMPSIRPGCLIAEVAQPAHTVEGHLLRNRRVLRVVQPNGMHISNDVTGEFSFGASGVLYELGVPASSMTGFTVAGNIFTLLHDITGQDGRFTLARRAGAFYGSPGLWVTGVSIGT